MTEKKADRIMKLGRPQPEVGYVSAACKVALTKKSHNNCASLRCTCECHKEQR